MKRYNITGLKVDLNVSEEGKTFRQAKDYESDFKGNADITIDISKEYLLERQRENPHLLYEDCEYIWTGYEFCTGLLDFEGFMLHSSAVAYENKAYLFSAPSGTGKSTHTEIWQRVFGSDKAVIINDDKPVIRCENEKFFVYGTPWSGKSDKNLNIKVPLCGICFIERSEKNHIKRIAAKEAAHLVLNQTVRPAYKERMINLLELLDKLLLKIPVYKLGCNMEDEAAKVSYNGMKNGI